MSNRLPFDEIEAELDITFFLERESIAFRETRGVSGMQAQIKRCPRCGDDRWRTYFGLETGHGNCFACGTGFSKISFTREHFQLPAWPVYADQMKDVMREQGWRPKRKAVALLDHGEVKMPSSDPLPLEDGSNLVYLEQRGFDGDMCRYMGLRWCQFGWWKYKDAEGVTQTQNFANRVIIPVFDLDGTLKTFQGRDLSGVSSRKYLFPSELPGTGRYLYNGQNVLATDHVCMGEGAFDVGAIKLALDGEQALRHVVPIGSFGKHLSYGSMDGDDQLGRLNQLKSRGLKFITIMWDGEEKALIAALNAAKLITGIGLTARIALLPPDKDPNEVLPEVVRKAFYEAKTWTPALDIKMRLRNPYTQRRTA